MITKRLIDQKSVLLKFIVFLPVFICASIFVKAQQVTEIITDFGGYWRSGSTAVNPIKPDNSHNVLAFKIGTQTYSTGVDNSILTSKGIPFTTGTFKSLPINSISGTVTQSYIALAGKYDGVANGYSSPRPNVKMKDVLTDGINGLNIGTGVIDFPSTAKLSFPVQSIDINSIADAKPDILFTQIANISSGFSDRLYFVNSSGAVVGNTITLNWGVVQVVGNYTLDFYTLQRGVTSDQSVIIGDSVANTTRPLRLTAFRLSDFGITSGNAALVKSLIIQPGGQSDIGFVAYNSDGFVITPPSIITQPKSLIVCAGTGQNAVFSVVATGSEETYQWTKNGEDIPGANSPSYTISPVTKSDGGAYQVVISNSMGSITSHKAFLNTSITKHPSLQINKIVTGNAVKLGVGATNVTNFQWKKNGVDIPGAIDSVLVINSLSRADSGSYNVSVSNAANHSCTNLFSNVETLTPVIIVYSRANGNLNDPSTWGADNDGKGSTPVDFTRAEHTFVLSNRDSGKTVTDLKIAGTLDVNNGIAIISDGTNLDVGWAIRTGSGSIAGSSSTGLTVRGNSSLYFTPGRQILKSFTITGGTITMLSDLAIAGGINAGKLNLTGGILAVGPNKITLKSTTTTNTSMVTKIGNGASITYGSGGAFVVERFVPAKRSFRFISPAVTTTTSIKTNWMEGVTNPDRYSNFNPIPGFGTHITGPKTAADSLDVTQTYNPSLFTFEKNAQTWIPVPNSSGTLAAGNPVRLMVRGSRAVDLNNNEATPSNTIIRTTGSLYTGTYIVGSNLLATEVGSYSYVGNPYASPVNWNTITTSGVAKSYYTWDEKFNNRGAYVSYNSVAETNSNPSSFVDENIQSGQAFLVQTTGNNPSVRFAESDKTEINTSVFRQVASKPKISVQLLINLNGGVADVADGVTAVFGPDFKGVIAEEDSYKFTNLDENIAVNRNGTTLSIEGRPEISNSDTLPLKLWQFRQKDYWFKINASNFTSAITASLKDNFLKVESSIDLAAPTIVPFTITTDPASFAPDRFSIVFQSAKTLPVTITKLTASPVEKGIQVEWKTEMETNVISYELERSPTSEGFDKVYTMPASTDNQQSHTYKWLDETAVPGKVFYRIKIIDKSGIISYSPMVRVNVTQEKSGFTIFPNPVKGNTFTIRFDNLIGGKYSVHVFNNIGQRVYASSVLLPGGASVETIKLSSKIGPGNYNLKLFNGQASKTQSLFIR